MGSRQGLFVTVPPGPFAGRQASWTLERMRVDMTRRGGFAGVALHAALDTAQLADPDASRVEAALRDLPWDRSTTGSIEADRFRYEMVTVERDHERRVVLGESEIPDALRPLLALLADHGQIRPASG